jgi:hypothetical protein
MKKKLLFTALFAGFFAVSNAQSNSGTDYFALGEYGTAKEYFEQNLSKAPAESNYYLGEIAFKEGKADVAKANFEKGIAADPLYALNYVGQGKLLLKSDQKAAETLFATALKKNKKDVAVNVAIARAYFDCGMKDVALLKLEVARKVGKKSPLVYILEGDMCEKPSDAASKYEQAVYFDPTNVVAAIKFSEVYLGINPQLAVEKLKKVVTDHPDFMIAYRDLGNGYSKNGQYLTSIESYKKYFEGGTFTAQDAITFASAYFFTDQFQESYDIINKGLALEPNNFLLNRLRVYNAAKLKDPEGLAYSDAFFKLTSENGFIYQDYVAKATLLSQSGDYAQALEIFNKVISEDATKPDVYKELFSVYNKKGDKVNAAKTYRKYMDLMGEQYVGVLDYYQLGRAYYSVASSSLKDSTEAGKAMVKEYVLKADSAFAKVCDLTPDSYTGYLWRGNVNCFLDLESTQGLAKPYYEAAITAILNKAKDTGLNGNTKDLIDCYRYLGYYYYLKNDKENSVKYCDSILALDPNNATAKALKDSFK